MSFTVGSYRRTRRWAIDSDGVARLVEISSAVKIVLLAMCFLVFAFCLVRWDLSLSDNDSVLFGTCNKVQLSIYVSSVFPQSGFRLHSSFAEIFRLIEVGCHIWSSSDLYIQGCIKTLSWYHEGNSSSYSIDELSSVWGRQNQAIDICK